MCHMRRRIYTKAFSNLRVAAFFNSVHVNQVTFGELEIYTVYVFTYALLPVDVTEVTLKPIGHPEDTEWP